ncbi:hypothetical protein SAMN05444162_1547 [Paenibacillaceae bacterium GAS479]|nr:hypothetical protein SAMN05444162_1547 [Paenibacillaceae bacterium GAS479]
MRANEFEKINSAPLNWISLCILKKPAKIIIYSRILLTIVEERNIL